MLQGQLGEGDGVSKQRRGLWLWTSAGGKAEGEQGRRDPGATSIRALREDLGAPAPAGLSDTDPHGHTAGAAGAEAAARPSAGHSPWKQEGQHSPSTNDGSAHVAGGHLIWWQTVLNFYKGKRRVCHSFRNMNTDPGLDWEVGRKAGGLCPQTPPGTGTRARLLPGPRGLAAPQAPFSVRRATGTGPSARCGREDVQGRSGVRCPGPQQWRPGGRT